MNRTILLLGQDSIGKQRLSDTISQCELPESDLIIENSFVAAEKLTLDHNVWLVLINAANFSAIKKFLETFNGRKSLTPIIVIHSAERKDLEVLISLGACDVISPDFVDANSLTQSILSAVERKRIESDLTSRDLIMQVINYAAEVFLLHLDWDSRIEDVLKRFGEASQADKVCIYRNAAGDGQKNTRAELHAGWVSKENYHVDQAHSISDCEPVGFLIPRWVDIMRSGEMMIGCTQDFPSEEQPALQKRLIQSLAVIPIFSDHVWWGFITLEHCRIEKQWTTQEMEALRTAARIFGAGISRVDAETRLTHLATHDFLTNLPNRMLLEDRFDQAVARAQRSKKKFGVVALDLDKFKQINDTYGHPFGDKVLIEIAWRLSEAIRTSDTCARVGGDEFTVIAEGINNKHDLIRVMEKLSQALLEPIRIEDRAVKVTASIGASIYPNHGQDMETLMKAADVALYRVKGAYSGYHIYSSAKQISLIDE
jgi:diguanylate cyclase (GGDEF)-like protein